MSLWPAWLGRRAQREQPPWLRTLPETEVEVASEACELATTIAADAHKIDRAWAHRMIAVLGDVAYVEIVGEGDGGVLHGNALREFAEAATRGSAALAATRQALIDAVGPEAFVEAAATVGVFNGLVRIADATGVPLDDRIRAATGKFREELGLNEFGGSANTDDSLRDTEPDLSDPTKLFE